MPIPTAITDLSTTAASNYPQGTDSPSTLDDVQRAHGSFIRQLHTGAVATTANVTAGTINGATVGATTPSTGAFTTLSASGKTGIALTNNSTGLTEMQIGNNIVASAGDGSGVGFYFNGSRLAGIRSASKGGSLKTTISAWSGSAEVETVDISSAGLAVTGALSSTGVITQSGGSGASTANIQLASANTASQYRVVWNNAGADFAGIGSNASGDVIIGRASTLAGAVASTQATFSSTGLAVTGVLSATNGTVVAPVAFASLPASPVAGQRAMINNSVAAPAFLSIAAGGGSTTVPVFYNGTTWLVG